MPNVGELLAGRYNLVRLIGEGGFARVFEATDTRASGRVAIKVLHASKSMDHSFAERFRQEVMLCRQLQHPNTIKITDTGQTEEGCLYMVMEFVNGAELQAIIRKTGAMPPERTFRITEQVLRALAEAHEKGIVHRDLKPANIMIGNLAGEEDFVKVLDFGIAKALEPEMSKVQTRAGLVFCTPKYAAPEILLSKGVTPSADVYSLGLIVIEMLTGQQAIQAPSDAEAIAAALSPMPHPIPPSVVGTPFAEVVRRSTAKSFDERYKNAQEMLADVREANRSARPAGISGQFAAMQGATQGKTMQMPGPASGPISGPISGPLSGPLSGPIQQPSGGSKVLTILLVLLTLGVLGVGAFVLVTTMQESENGGGGTTTTQQPTPRPQEPEPPAPEPPPEPEPPVEVAPNWGEQATPSLAAIAPAAPVPGDEAPEARLDRVSNLDRSAQATRDAADLLRTGLIARQIEDPHREAAREALLLQTENLIHLLDLLDFCGAARARLDETARDASVTIPTGSYTRIAAMRARVDACAQRVAGALPEWDRRAFQALVSEAQELFDRAQALPEGSHDQLIAFAETLQRSRRAAEMLLAGIEAQDLRPRELETAQAELNQLRQWQMVAELALEFRTAAWVEVASTLERIDLLPEGAAGFFYEVQALLDAERRVTPESEWSWPLYAELSNEAARAYARSQGVDWTPPGGDAGGGDAPDEGAPEDPAGAPAEGSGEAAAAGE
jgi:serine/threonine protein kinase